MRYARWETGNAAGLEGLDGVYPRPGARRDEDEAGRNLHGVCSTVLHAFNASPNYYTLLLLLLLLLISRAAPIFQLAHERVSGGRNLQQANNEAHVFAVIRSIRCSVLAGLQWDTDIRAGKPPKCQQHRWRASGRAQHVSPRGCSVCAGAHRSDWC